MNIAFVIYNWSESKGGVERYAYNLADYLAKEGNEIHVFCHQVFESPRPGGITLHPVPAFPVYSPLKHLFFARNVVGALSGRQFDIIQHFGRTYYRDAGPNSAARQVYRFGSGCHWEYLKRTRPLMGNTIGRALHSLSPKNRIIMYLERQSFSDTAQLWAGSGKRVICNSNQGKMEIQNYYHIPDENITVIHNGVDLEKFNPGNRERYGHETRRSLGLKEDDVVLLFAGNNFETKGLRFAIEGLALVPADRRSKLKLLVVGKGRAAKYRAIARSYKIDSQVLFAGAQAQIERYYAVGDIFLYPTLHDPFATVCLEAMASGLPVITTRANGASEIISDSIDSFVADNPPDSRAIAEKIVFLLDLVWRRNMARAAALTASKYSFDNNFRQVKGIYKEITNNKVI